MESAPILLASLPVTAKSGRALAVARFDGKARCNVIGWPEGIIAVSEMTPKVGTRWANALIAPASSGIGRHVVAPPTALLPAVGCAADLSCAHPANDGITRRATSNETRSVMLSSHVLFSATRQLPWRISPDDLCASAPFRVPAATFFANNVNELNVKSPGDLRFRLKRRTGP